MPETEKIAFCPVCECYLTEKQAMRHNKDHQLIRREKVEFTANSKLPQT
jgi:hypothetical protein